VPNASGLRVEFLTLFFPCLSPSTSELFLDKVNFSCYHSERISNATPASSLSPAPSVFSAPPPLLRLPPLLPLSPVFRTLFQVPYPATPLFATLTRTAGCVPKIPILELIPRCASTFVFTHLRGLILQTLCFQIHACNGGCTSLCSNYKSWPQIVRGQPLSHNMLWSRRTKTEYPHRLVYPLT